jgi:hypothetical protein
VSEFYLKKESEAQKAGADSYSGVKTGTKLKTEYNYEIKADGSIVERPEFEDYIVLI